jgi:ABC-type sugar transport system, periplasmic component
MRKKPGLLLAIVMALTLVLAACGGGSDAGKSSGSGNGGQSSNAGSGSSQASGGSSGSGESTGKVKATYWTWLSNQQAAVDQFNAMQDEVEIELVQMSHTDIAQKLLIALSSGSGAPDLFQQPQRTFSNISKTGKLMDLTEIMKPHNDKFPESMTSLLMYDGKQYGIAPDISPGVLWYRKDIFEENGIGEIKTWSEFIAAGEKLKEKGYYIMPVFNPAGSWGANAIALFMQSRGGNFFTEDGKVIHNNAELEYTLKFFKDVLDSGIGQGLTFFTPEFWGEFKADKIVAWPMNIAEGANIKANMPEQSGKWSVMPFPKWDDKDTVYTGLWGGTAIGIPEMSPVKDKVVKYAEWLATTTEGQKAMYSSWGSVPSNQEAIQDPFFSQGDPFYSGENPLAKINEFPAFHYFDFSKVEAIVGEQVDLMFAGKQDPTTTARNIEQMLAKETGR